MPHLPGYRTQGARHEIKSSRVVWQPVPSTKRLAQKAIDFMTSFEDKPVSDCTIKSLASCSCHWPPSPSLFLSSFGHSLRLLLSEKHLRHLRDEGGWTWECTKVRSNAVHDPPKAMLVKIICCKENCMHSLLGSRTLSRRSPVKEQKP